MRRIGLYGSMFDPVHLDDVRLVTDALLRMRLDEVILLPYDTEEACLKTASRRDRLNMLALAFAGLPGVTLAEERFQPGLQGLIDASGRVLADADADLTLLIDAVGLPGFLNACSTTSTWDNCGLLVYPRRGEDHRSLVAEAAQRVFAFACRTSPVTLPLPCVGKPAGDAPDMLIPVAEYIALHGLYQPPYRCRAVA